MVTERVTIAVGTRGVKAASRGIKKVSKESRSAAKSVKLLASSVKLLGAAAVALGVIKLAQGLLSISKNAIEAASSFEQYGVRLKALLGSQTEANKALDTFVKIAAKTPFAVDQVVSGAATLGSAALGNRKKLESLTQTAANLAAITGLSFQDAASNLQRALSAGIGAADLFRDRGVTPLIEAIGGIPDATKLSTDELAALFQTAFGTGGVFGKAAENLSLTLGGALSNIGDAADDARRSLGDAFSGPVIKAAREVIVPFLTDLKKLFVDNKEAITEFVTKGIETAIRAFGLFVEAGIAVLRVMNRINQVGQGFQGILAEERLGEATARLERIRSNIKVARERRADEGPSASLTSPAARLAAQLEAQLPEAEQDVLRARAAVDGMAGDFRQASIDADKFAKVLDDVLVKVRRLSSASVSGARVEQPDEGPDLPPGVTEEERLNQIRSRIGGTRGEGLLAASSATFDLQDKATQDARAEDKRRTDEKAAKIQANKDAAKQFGQDMANEIKGTIHAALRGEAIDFAKVLGDFGAKSIETAFDDLFDNLAEGLGKALADTPLDSFAGKFGKVLGATIGIAFSLISGALQDTEATTTQAAQSAVTDSRAIRGVVAGPTSVPIFQLGAEIQDAFVITNEILLRILAAVESSGAIGGVAGTSASPGADLVTTPSLV